MLNAYVPILVLSALVVAFAVGNMVLSELAGSGKRLSRRKGEAYECGMQPEGSAHLRLSIHFYLVAVLFILFDVESIFLVLWAVAAKGFTAQGVGSLVFAEITIFVALLAVALAYVWRKGGLEWDR